jgi:hypothetical protein
VLHTDQYALVPGDLLLLVELPLASFSVFDHRVSSKINIGLCLQSSLSA